MTRLDDLNAFGLLESVQPEGMLCYGPKVIHSKANLGVAIWMRPPGYHNYKTLNVLAIWALDDQTVTFGTYQLPYNAAFYTPEAYFKNIRRDFIAYYGRIAPPPQTVLWQASYDPARRLALRHKLAAAVAAWP